MSKQISEEVLQREYLDKDKTLWAYAYTWDSVGGKIKYHMLPTEGFLRTGFRGKWVFHPLGAKSNTSGVSKTARSRVFASTYEEACAGYLEAKGSHPEPGNGAKWVPTKGRIFPDDGVIVQVTYRGILPGDTNRCDRFAYRENQTWKWEFDRENAVIPILAWRPTGKPYQED